MHNPKFELIRHDITEPISLEVDRIWHLACPASPIHYQSNPIKTAKTNFLGTYNMLGLSKRNNARILFTSTSEVYGDPEVHPQPETYKGNVNNSITAVNSEVLHEIKFRVLFFHLKGKQAFNDESLSLRLNRKDHDE